jgi:hypothetical protein
MRHLTGMARGARLRELIADVLPENGAMLKVFAKSGFPLRTKRESDVVRVALRLDATRRDPPSPPPGRAAPS